MSSEASLYERIGGEATVTRVLETFYARVLDDPTLEPFFRHTSMPTLRKMQLEFFGAALDGPQTYSGLSLSHIHQGRGITVHHFNSFTQHLLDTLNDAELDQADVDEIINRINTYADNIVGGSTISE